MIARQSYLSPRDGRDLPFLFLPRASGGGIPRWHPCPLLRAAPVCLFPRAGRPVYRGRPPFCRPCCRREFPGAKMPSRRGFQRMEKRLCFLSRSLINHDVIALSRACVCACDPNRSGMHVHCMYLMLLLPVHINYYACNVKSILTCII